MGYRCSFIFSAGNSGWSEQWYYAGSGSPADIPGRIITPAFLKGFLSLRASGVYLDALRVNDVDVPRNSFLQTLEIDSGDYSGGVTSTGEEPAVCALGYVLTNARRRRPVMVRGLVDAGVSRDADDNVVWTGAMQTVLKSYSQAIIAAALCVRTLDPPDATNTDRLLKSMAPAAQDSGATTFTYTNGVELIEGADVIIHGLSRKYYPGYQGPLPGYNVTPTTVDVPVAWKSASLQIPIRNGHIRNAQYSLDPVYSISWETMRVKKVGRPSLLPRGRRSGIAYRAR